jgi:choline dehydrogenase-like flavoprotein
MILTSMESQGLPLHADMFTTGDYATGCGHVPRTHYQGNRSTSADYLVSKGSNLAIKTETIVDRIIIEGQGANQQAVAVRVVEKDGTVKDIKARKEIIVSGGAYCSPAILMRSGLGKKEDLATHGIECKVDLPGVGSNLMDHLVRLPNLKSQVYD